MGKGLFVLSAILLLILALAISEIEAGRAPKLCEKLSNTFRGVECNRKMCDSKCKEEKAVRGACHRRERKDTCFCYFDCTKIPPPPPPPPPPVLPPLRPILPPVVLPPVRPVLPPPRPVLPPVVLPPVGPILPPVVLPPVGPILPPIGPILPPMVLPPVRPAH